jgi:hypothetical protein
MLLQRWRSCPPPYPEHGRTTQAQLSMGRSFTVAKVTGPGSYHLQTLQGEDLSNSWNVDQLCRFYAQSLEYAGGSSLHDYSRIIRCKRPTSPGTSLRTTLLREPALTATNGTRAAYSVKDSSGDLSREHVLQDPVYTATNGSTAVSGYTP